MNWYFEQNGVSHGPVTEQVLTTRVQSKIIAPETLVWHPGLDEWQPVSQLCPQWLETSAAKSGEAKATSAAAEVEPGEEKGGFFKKIFGGKKK